MFDRTGTTKKAERATSDGSRHKPLERTSRGLANPAWHEPAVGDAKGMRISDPNEAAEREADCAADRAMTPGGVLTTGASESAQNQSRTSGGSGEPLADAVASYFGTRLGFDFSAVRVHTDAAASEAAQSIYARAFTRGADIVFNRGEYAPESGEGRWLLAHELAHVARHQSSDVIHRQPINKTPV